MAAFTTPVKGSEAISACGVAIEPSWKPLQRVERCGYSKGREAM